MALSIPPWKVRSCSSPVRPSFDTLIRPSRADFMIPDWIERGPNGASLPVRRETRVVDGGIGVSGLVVEIEPIVGVDFGMS